jgi:hypothetical protein
VTWSKQWDSDKPAVTSGDVVIVKEGVEAENFAALWRASLTASACSEVWNDELNVGQERLFFRSA